MFLVNTGDTTSRNKFATLILCSCAFRFVNPVERRVQGTDKLICGRANTWWFVKFYFDIVCTD